MLCMETVIKVRRLHFKDKLSQRAIAERLGISRTTVRKYLKQELTQAPSFTRTRIHYPKLGNFIPLLTERLNHEIQLPERQRHTARRHFEWLQDQGFEGQYCSVSAFIRKFNQQHQPSSPPAFIKQRFAPAEAYQFDWSIETVQIAGLAIKVNVAHFRLCHSRACFVVAYPNQKIDMLIDAHNQAFSFFGGVPNRGIYDNMKTAVKSIGKGKERTFNDQFLCMMSHFLIEPVACTPASGWEKGQVERQVKTLRKRLFQPMLAFHSLYELNAYLKEQCLRLMEGSKHPEMTALNVSQALQQERLALNTYQPYLGLRLEVLRVNSQSLVRIDNHQYSVPVACVGKAITAHISAHSIRLTNGSQLLAEHTRSFQRSGISYQPSHYLDLLERKPGALRNGEPFLDWALPKPIKQLQSLLMKQIRGDKAMVKLLALMSEYDTDLALTAAELALEEGMVTPEAVLNIINRLKEPLPPKLSIDDIPLTLPPSVNCQQYDSLLTKGSYAKG